jgi:octaprenyl-diphosphate synthase
MHMQQFGEHVGLAFQIRDDLLDVLGRSTVLGKPTAEDIKEKKLTLPLIYALQASDRKTAKQALRFIKRGARSKEIQWLIRFITDAGGIAYATQAAERYAALAREDLASFPDSPAKTSFLQFVDFVIQRNS